MKTIWVVEADCDGDYGVVAMFSTKENAEKAAAMVGGIVSEWVLDLFIDDISQGRRPYFLSMERDGRVTRFDSGVFPEQGKEGLRLYDFLWREGIFLSGTVFATDKEHAIKIANEVRAQHIAEGRWPEKD